MKMIPRNNSFKRLNRPLDNQGGMRKKQKEHTKAQNEKSLTGTDSKTGLEATSLTCIWNPVWNGWCSSRIQINKTNINVVPSFNTESLTCLTFLKNPTS